MKTLIKLVASLTIAVILFITVKPNSDQSRELSKHVVPFKVLLMDNNNYATGFYIKFEGKTFIVTNKHVCDFHQKVYKHNFIQFDNYIGEIIKISDVHDLCLVTSNRTDGLELSDTPAMPLDHITLIGFPRGMDKVIREGRVISYIDIFAGWLGDSGKDVESIQISTTSYGRNSGSPVLNSSGKVIGVLFAGSPAYHTEGWVVPLSYLTNFLTIYAH